MSGIPFGKKTAIKPITTGYIYRATLTSGSEGQDRKNFDVDVTAAGISNIDKCDVTFDGGALFMPSSLLVGGEQLRFTDDSTVDATSSMTARLTSTTNLRISCTFSTSTQSTITGRYSIKEYI